MNKPIQSKDEIIKLTYSIPKSHKKGELGHYTDLTGLTLGRWSVLSKAPSRKSASGTSFTFWKCRCECGKEKEIRGVILMKGQSRSCGCYFKEVAGICANNKPILIGATGESWAAFNKVFRNYKCTAEWKNREFNLTEAQALSLYKAPCFYCGTAPKSTSQLSGQKAALKFIYNGIDRVDNTKGYDIDNVVTCCSICNRMKANLLSDVFKAHINKIHSHWASK